MSFTNPRPTDGGLSPVNVTVERFVPWGTRWLYTWYPSLAVSPEQAALAGSARVNWVAEAPEANGASVVGEEMVAGAFRVDAEAGRASTTTRVASAATAATATASTAFGPRRRAAAGLGGGTEIG